MGWNSIVECVGEIVNDSNRTSLMGARGRV
jgi:hypothetical protein